MKRLSIFYLFIALCLFLTAQISFADSPTTSPLPLQARFNVICKDPCPFDQQYISNFKRRTIFTYLALRNLIKTDLPREFFPIPIHLTEDDICSTEVPNAAHTIRTGPNKGTICKFSVQTKAQVSLLRPYGGMAHEMLHLFFPPADKPENLERFEHPLIYTLEDIVTTPAGARTFCNNNYGLRGFKQQIIYKLCKKTGFDLKDVPLLLKKIQAWKASHSEIYDRVKPADYAPMLKEILHQDVSDIVNNTSTIPD